MYHHGKRESDCQRVQMTAIEQQLRKAFDIEAIFALSFYVISVLKRRRQNLDLSSFQGDGRL